MCGSIVEGILLCSVLFMQWFSHYGPDYTLHFPPGNKQDMNKTKHLTELVDTISGSYNQVLCTLTMITVFVYHMCMRVHR